MPSKLILTRKSEWTNRRQRYKIFIDNQEVGRFKVGESHEFDLEPGSHTILAKHLWMTSEEKTINITEGKNIHLTISSGMKYFVPFYIMLLVSLLSPLLARWAKIDLPENFDKYRIFLIVPAITYLILYYTVFRKKYISIDEEEHKNPFR